jgi:hypothetical protein
MGQFSVEKPVPPGSAFSGNQHLFIKRVSGPSPRGRGRRARRVDAGREFGTIPAWAGASAIQCKLHIYINMLV